MGYTTDFEGVFQLDRPLSSEHFEYLAAFASSRHMGRREVTSPDPLREAVGLPFGVQGEFFIGGGGTYRDDQSGVIDYNKQATTQPGLWCQWTPIADDDGLYSQIGWDEGEKFYNYIEWLEYIIKNFLEPWGYKLNGKVEWAGEWPKDQGTLICKDNVVKVANKVMLFSEIEEKDLKELFAPCADFLEENGKFEPIAKFLRDNAE